MAFDREDGVGVQDLFGPADLDRPVERVLMSLNPQYYELIWQRLKRHEFRRRYLAGRPTRSNNSTAWLRRTERREPTTRASASIIFKCRS